MALDHKCGTDQQIDKSNGFVSLVDYEPPNYNLHIIMLTALAIHLHVFALRVGISQPSLVGFYCRLHQKFHLVHNLFAVVWSQLRCMIRLISDQ
jgi:hypothetical protein